MEKPFDPTTGILYVWSHQFKKQVPAAFRYMPGSNYVTFPVHIHPDDQDKMKSTFSQSVAKVASAIGYSNVKVDWDYNEQPGRTVGVYATLSANGKTSTPIAIGMLAYFYNSETNTDGPTGQVYLVVANAINKLFES